jgi:hypothetical protein
MLVGCRWIESTNGKRTIRVHFLTAFILAQQRQTTSKFTTKTCSDVASDVKCCVPTRKRAANVVDDRAVDGDVDERKRQRHHRHGGGDYDDDEGYGGRYDDDEEEEEERDDDGYRRTFVLLFVFSTGFRSTRDNVFVWVVLCLSVCRFRDRSSSRRA